MDLSSIIEERKSLIDSALDYFIPREKEHPSSIHSAMRYSVFAGGKRLRPLLALFSAELFSPRDWWRVIPAAAALELIHTYSLIHDDLPAMDDDNYRRGRLTCHKMYGEAVAILAGDALLTLAFEILTSRKYEQSKICKSYWENVTSENKIQVISELAQAAGVSGMIAGQVVDLDSESKKVTEEALDYINSHKTGALITSSVRIGAILCSEDVENLRKLTAFASALGKAFQLVDDILDVEGDENRMGKATGRDAEKEKATYISVYGIEKTRLLRDELFHKALRELSPLGERSSSLKNLAKLIIYREY